MATWHNKFGPGNPFDTTLRNMYYKKCLIFSRDPEMVYHGCQQHVEEHPWFQKFPMVNKVLVRWVRPIMVVEQCLGATNSGKRWIATKEWPNVPWLRSSREDGGIEMWEDEAVI